MALPRISQVNAFNLDDEHYSIVTVSDTNTTVSDQPGPGRTLGRLLKAGGASIDSALSAAGELMRLGPTALMISMLTRVSVELGWVQNLTCFLHHERARAALSSRARPSFEDVIDYLLHFTCVDCRQRHCEFILANTRWRTGCGKLLRFFRRGSTQNRAVAMLYILALVYLHPELRKFFLSMGVDSLVEDACHQAYFRRKHVCILLIEVLQEARMAFIERHDLPIYDPKTLGRSWPELLNERDNQLLGKLGSTFSHPSAYLELAFECYQQLSPLAWQKVASSEVFASQLMARLRPHSNPLHRKLLQSLTDRMDFTCLDDANGAECALWTHLWLPLWTSQRKMDRTSPKDVACAVAPHISDLVHFMERCPRSRRKLTMYVAEHVVYMHQHIEESTTSQASSSILTAIKLIRDELSPSALVSNMPPSMLGEETAFEKWLRLLIKLGQFSHSVLDFPVGPYSQWTLSGLVIFHCGNLVLRFGSAYLSMLASIEGATNTIGREELFIYLRHVIAQLYPVLYHYHRDAIRPFTLPQDDENIMEYNDLDVQLMTSLVWIVRGLLDAPDVARPLKVDHLTEHEKLIAELHLVKSELHQILLQAQPPTFEGIPGHFHGPHKLWLRSILLPIPSIGWLRGIAGRVIID